jgi:uncharacterized repeat protein (TIGR01451 family)
MNQITRRHRAARLASAFAVAVALGLSMQLVDVSAQSGQLPVPLPGRNVNMVSGKNHPDGDPFLQRQNEPSIAVSTRNPEHLLGAANDYRTVDIPGLGEEVNGDAWIGVFKSFDGGKTFKSTLLPGYRQDATTIGKQSPLYGLEAGADPVVRAGTNGLFYLAGMAFNRDQDAGRIFLSRYIDNNNLEAGDSIAYIGTTVVDIGNTNRFLDKPWMTVDIPRAMKGEARTDAKDKADKNAHNGVPKKATSGAVCTVPGQAQPIPAGNIYIVYSVFLDNDSGDQKKDANGKTSFERELDRLEREEGKEKDEHKPGQPVDGRTKIMLARSTDCGATFDAPKQISDRTQINQGATLAIDPATGTVYVAWREFLSSKQPDAILVAKSTDFGRTFSTPVVLRTIMPFDQGTTSTSFRTNSYPTMAVDGVGRVYVAWAQRGAGMSGDARIVISSSTDGKTWSDPAPADNPPQRGHQFMPVLTFGGGRLHLVFWDQRDDMSKMWGYFIDEAPILNYVGPKETRPTRHTLDLRAVSAWPGAPPQWGPSAKVSNYLEGIMPGKTKAEQLQFNAPNLPLFSLGTKPFIGDYLDVTVSPTFIANGDGTWRFNTLSSDPAQYFTAWGDNRDVRPPKDGNWVHYTPPTFAGYTGTSIYDPSQPVEMCKPGQAGMRDQNVYSAKVSSVLIVTTPGNNKRLGFVTDANGVKRLMDRTFVITVANPDAKLVKSVVLHITSQPPGGRASFLQFSQLIDLPVDIAPESSISREVFVTSTDPAATVPLTVTEGSSPDVSARLYLNPDPTNPDIDNPDIDNGGIQNPDIDNAEAHNITVSTPDIDNPDIDNVSTLNPDIDNPDIDNPDIDNTRLINKAILNPDIDNPDIDNPDIDNTNILNPDIDNPDIDNPDIDNGALTDVMWNVANIGNTATSYQVKLLLKQAQQQRLLNAGVKFQLLVTKTTAAPTIDKCAVVEPNRNLTVVKINSPSFVDPTNEQQRASILTPDIDNPDIDNATVALAPGDNARVTLRIFSPVGDTTPTEGSGGGDPLEDLTGALEDLQHVGVATTSHPVDTLAVIAGETTPHVEASIPLITTATLRDATRGSIYTDTIEQSGSAAPFAFTITGGGLPQGLTLNADGTITGTPAVSGSFTFSVKVTDAQDNYATATLTLRVFEPIIVAGTTLASAGINQPYSATVSATGGFPPYTWTVFGGALPAGLSLTPAGVVTGTPTQSGTFNFVAMAMDSAFPPKSAAGAFVLKVAAAANPQNVNVVEDTATPITVTGTGTGPFTFNVGNTPAHGNLNGNGPFTYTPDLNYTGPDNFTFTATQGDLTSAPATVSINVTAVNDAPSATPKTVNTPQGVAIPIVLTGTDPENNPLTFSIAANPTTGTLSGVAPNVTYNPPLNGFTGTATFTFRANDGSLNSAPATVTVIVGPPPANSADVTLTLADAPDPVALGGSVTYTATLHNNGPAAATGVALSLTYPFADLLVQSVVPSQGNCAPGVAITCTIGVIANDGNATVTVTMKAFNHGGAFTVSGSSTGTLLDYNTTNNTASQTTTVTGPATATTDLHVSQLRPEGSVAFNGTIAYTVSVTNHGPSDATGVSLTSSFTPGTAQFVSALPSQGSCSIVGSQITCSVGDLDANVTATCVITFKAIGPGTISNTATVSGGQSDPNAANNTHTLTAPVANRMPTATTDNVNTREDVASTFAVVSNDSDPDNDTLLLTTVGEASHGSALIAGNSVFYTPAPNYFGSDTFSYQVSDGHGGTANGTVNVSVLPVNDAPTLGVGANQTVAQGSGAHTSPLFAVSIVGPANEAGQTVSYVVGNDKHNLFAVQPSISPNGSLTFTTAATGTGTAIVTVAAVDSGGTENGGSDSSATQSFTITLSDVPTGSTTFTVTNTNDSGNGSLRAAILAANATVFDDTITFDIPGSGPFTIHPLSPLPAITSPVVIDATSQSGYAGTPIVELDGTNAGAAANGVYVSAPNTTIRGLVVNRFALEGIVIDTHHGVVRGNYVGVDVTGTQARPNGRDGVLLHGAPNQVGGSDAADRNVVSGNTFDGIIVQNPATAGNVIQGNYVGTNAAGTAAIGNGRWGITLEQSNSTTVGGDNPGQGNLVSGNLGYGIHVYYCAPPNICGGHLIAGNRVGTDVTGMSAIANLLDGVHITYGPSNTIRGNVISGNGDANFNPFGHGISIQGTRLIDDPQAELHYGNQTITNNLIGVAADGASALPNFYYGIQGSGAINPTIGGGPLAGNTIAFNRQGGIELGSNVGFDTNNSTISFNRILNNANDGVLIGYGANNRISRNEIYENGGLGIRLNPATGANQPVLLSANNTAGVTKVAVNFSGVANTSYLIELFSNALADPSGFGEGQHYVAEGSITTGANGIGIATIDVPLQAPGTKITATAGVSGTNTSEFSQAVTVTSNHAPTATDDTANAASGQTISINVLANDTDADGDALTVTGASDVSPPQAGSASAIATGVFFDAAPGFEGMASFDYSIGDDHGGSDTATVIVMIAPLCAPAPDRLTSWWNAEGHPNDIVGGNNGTLQNGASYAQGRVGQAFTFDGTDQYISIPDQPSLNPSGAFTVGGWFYIDPTAAGNQNDFSSLAAKSDGGSGGGGWYLAFEDRTHDKSVEFSVFGSTSLPYPNFELAHAANAIPSAGWYHIVGVFDPSAASGRTQLFINGVLKQSSVDPRLDSAERNTYAMRIGAMYHNEVHPGDGSNDRLNGQADEVQFFSRALVAPEIQEIYLAGSAGVCNCVSEPANLVGWWPGENDGADIRGGRNLANGGGSAVTFAAGVKGNAFSFNGNALMSTPFAHTGGFTVDFWVKATVPNQPLFTGVFATHNAADGSPHFQIELDGAGNYRFDAGNVDLVVPIGVASSSEFQHIAVTYDLTTVRTYLNGVPVASGVWTGATLGFTEVKLGTNRNSTNSFSGVIDEPHVFTVPLSPEQIAAIYRAASLGICDNRPPQGTTDHLLTSDGFAITSNPGANDTDPDVASTQIRAVYQPFGAAPMLTAPGEVVVVPGAGRAYFSGGNQNVFTSGKFGVLDLASNSISAVVNGTGLTGSTMSAVTSSQIVYMRTAGSSALTAIDARSNSPTFNKQILNLFFGNIQYLALDDLHHRLYVSAFTNGSARIVILDADTTSASFNEVIAEVASPTPNSNLQAIAVDSGANKVYFTQNGSPGLYVLDGATLSVKSVFTTLAPTMLAVNEIDHMVYAISGSSFVVVDGITDTPLSPLTNLGVPAGAGQFNTRMVVHRARGRVYVRTSEYPNLSRLLVIDGRRDSATIGQVLTTLSIGHEIGQTTMAIDETHDRLVTTSAADLKTTVVDTATNTIVGLPVPTGSPVRSNQPSVRVTIDAQLQRAYVAGAIGYIQVIDLTNSTQVALVPVGVELFSVAPDPVTHAAYIASTAVDASVVRLLANGASGSLFVPHARGRDIYTIRNNVTNKLYVLNSASNLAGDGDALPGFLQIFDSATNALEASVGVGQLPFGLAIDDDVTRNKVYVGNTTNGAQIIGGISIVDENNNHVVTQANLSAIPLAAGSPGLSIARDMVVNRTTGRLYFRITGGSATQAGVLNGSTGTALPIAGNVNIIKADPVLNRIYIGATPLNGGNNQIHVLNGDTDQEIATLTTGEVSPFIANHSYFATNHNTGELFAVDFDSSYLSIFNSNHVQVGSIPMPFGPQTVAVNETLNRIYVGSMFEKVLTIVDGATRRVVRSMTLPITPARIELDTAASPARLYVQSLPLEASVVVIDDPNTPAPRVTSVTQAEHGTVALNGDGSVTYAPTDGFIGVDSYSYTTTDGHGGTTTATAMINVIANFDIVEHQLPNPVLNVPYSQTLHTEGGEGVKTWTMSGSLPAGMRFDGTTGTISGVPRQAGQFFVTISARDSGSIVQLDDDENYSLNVDGGTLTMADLREGVILETQPSIQFIGGNGTINATLAAGSSLPAGLTLNANGSFSGSPRHHGTFDFTIELRDCLGGSCGSNFNQQVVSKNITWRVSAKDQQSGSQTQPAISFGGPNGRRLAQVVTIGSQGGLNGIGLQNITCPTVGTMVSVDIQRLNASGVPDGHSVASGTATANFNAIATAPSIGFAIDERFAFVINATAPCNITNAPITDVYNGGDAYADAGAGWQPLLNAPDLRYDIPSFRTLITPAIDVQYMTTAQGGNTATRLTSGRILVAGNSNGTAAHLFDENTGTFTQVTGALSASRQNATATVLGNGQVLLTGGRDQNGNRLITAEIYDPGTNTFIPTGNMNFARENHRAVWFVANGVGRVLITGGVTIGGGTIANAELYNPLTQTFTPISNMLLARQQHTVTLLDNNTILIAAGYGSGSGPSAEIYDPSTGVFTATANSMVVTNRGVATATKLNDGTVLIAGGQSNDVRAEAEIYDPILNTFSATSSMLSKRYLHTATLLNDGSVLVAGGFDQQNISNYTLALATTERYVPDTNNPGTGTWVAAAGLETRRQAHAAALLPSGKVLIVGSFSQSYMGGNTGELVDPAGTPTFTPATLANATPGNFYSVTFTGSGGSGGPYEITQESGQLPAGLTYDPLTQTLSGVPTTGLYTFAMRVTDSAHHANVRTLTLRAGSVLTITNAYRLLDAGQNEQYNVPLTATGGVGTLVWSLLPAVNNPLPAGITLSSDGVLSGSPATLGFFNFGVRVVDKVDNVIVADTYKMLAISVQSPLTITTAALSNPLLFQNIPGCLSSSGGTGTRTWSLFAGALPPGISINSSNGCFTGTSGALGTFNFTVKVTDQSSVPQADTKAFSVTITALNDQGSSSDSTQSAIGFGGNGGNRIAERVITGVTGVLSAVRVTGSSICPAGTNVTAEVQGVALNGGPDGTVLASGTAVYPSDITLNTNLFFTADQTFTIVFSADTGCGVRPSTFDSYPGEGYVFDTEWKRLKDVDASHRFDIPFQTIVTPSPGLGFMKFSRSNHTAIALNNGKILLVSDLTSELYDPATNTFTQTGNMTVQRFKPAATLLVDGRVLVTGGYNFSGVNGALVYLSSAEIFDPLDNTFSATSAMSTARAYHTATKLDDGTVLIAGGENFINSVFNRLRSTEIYTPGHGFSAGPDMAGARSIHTASLLGDGRVLILGGSGTFSSLQAAEIYTPGDPGSFANTINQPTVPFRNNHTATTLSNGLVLIAGGGGSLAGSNAELFDYHDETFSFAGTLLQPRTLHTATLLNDGTVLFSGGLDDSRCCGPYPAKPQLERFEYGVGFSNAGNMLVSRYFHAAALIPGSDRVLFTGSSGWSSAAGRLSEIYDPATVVALKDVNAPQGSVGNEYQSFTLDAIGGTAPYSITFLSGKLPDGLHYDAGNKVIYGTPSASGTFVATFKVQDSAGHSSTQTITIRVDALTITTTSLPIATVNRGYEAMLSSEGGTGTIKWSIYSGSLPAGIHLQESGLIDGTPAQTGFSGFTARAADDNGQIALRSFSFNVFSPMTITNSSLADGMAGETYFDCLNTINGNYPITWSVTGVPGLQFFEGSGCFDNTYPQRIMHQGGVFTATITATDSSAPVAQEDTRNFTLRLHAQDQGLGGGSTPDVALPSSRRAAQVLRAGTAYPSSGVQLWNISACTANTTITATLRPVTGMPERPDETGAPLAQATVTTDMNGYFNSRLAWPAPVAMPKGSLFAIVISFANGSCQGTFWPADEFYEFGQGWISDNGGVWKRSATEIGRADVPISTLVMPAADLLFTDTWRTQHVTATLDDGRILIAGGSDATAEIYDPATHTITATPGSMSTVRWNATATTLDDHNVLIVGGSHYNVDTQMTEAVSSADLFDPSTGLFSAAASLPGGRYNHTATKLDNDKVLIAGGLVAAPGGFFEGVGTAVLYSADGHSTTVLTMTGARAEQSATTLADGRVLIAGGWGGSPFPYSAEIFDPSDNSFTATSHEMPRFQPSHTATLLASGKVLIAGGLTGSYPDLSGDTQFYDPETDAFTNGPPMVTPRYDHAAIALGDGRVLLFGGGLKWSNWMPTAAVEIYDPVQNEFREIPDMVVDRYAPSVDLIASGPYLGQALLVGGQSTSNVAGRTVEHYQPNTSTLVIREQVLPTASLNVNYAVSLAVYGDTSGAVTFSLERGSLPSGLTLNGTGTITGSPSQASFHTFVVRAQDAASHVAYRTFSIRVDPLIITTNVLPPGVINQPYSQQIEHSGGVGDVVWSITSNNLPVGFTFSPSGLLSGQSATPVNMWVTVRAIDETGYAVYQTLLIEIVDP